VTTSDWIILGFLAPLLILGCWWQTIGVWRSGKDVSRAVDWFTGQGGAPGYHAFMGPVTSAMTVGWIAAMVELVRKNMTNPPDWMDVVVGVGFALCVGFIALGLWLWAFKWPTFLVPPQFRGR
jgi:hypothetical protein